MTTPNDARAKKVIADWVTEAFSDQPKLGYQLKIRQTLFDAIDAHIKARVTDVMRSALNAAQADIQRSLSVSAALERHEAYAKNAIASIKQKITRFERQVDSNMQTLLERKFAEHFVPVTNKLSTLIVEEYLKRCGDGEQCASPELSLDYTEEKK